jgi:hypothetical protein
MKIKIVASCLFVLFAVCILIASRGHRLSPTQAVRASTTVQQPTPQPPAVEKSAPVPRQTDSVRLRGKYLIVGMTADDAFEILQKSDETSEPSTSSDPSLPGA